MMLEKKYDKRRKDLIDRVKRELNYLEWKTYSLKLDGTEKGLTHRAEIASYIFDRSNILHTRLAKLKPSNLQRILGSLGSYVDNISRKLHLPKEIDPYYKDADTTAHQ